MKKSEIASKVFGVVDTLPLASLGAALCRFV
jgi:hypothetical protein